jgi:drug/metabolite transporter (DMT)-like permease
MVSRSLMIVGVILILGRGLGSEASAVWWLLAGGAIVGLSWVVRRRLWR